MRTTHYAAAKGSQRKLILTASGPGPRLLAALALLTAIPDARIIAQEEVGITRGAAAPAIEIEDLDGNAVDLGDLIGSKPVLLEFWATWCENCEALA
ncbi:MAG: redoxin domain-containing protein, partial [Gemmatimonadota bacterium]